MLNLLSALAATAAIQAAPATTAATPAAPAPAAVPAAPKLGDLAGVTISHYDVSGQSLDELKQVLTAQRPQGAAGSNWTVGASLQKRTVGEKCKITGADVKFTGTAQLPRLATPQLLKPEEMKIWNGYVASLEVTAAEDLSFVHQRIGRVRDALVSASCDNAGAVANAAIDKLKAEQQQFVKQRSAARAVQAQQFELQRKAALSGKPDQQ